MLQFFHYDGFDFLYLMKNIIRMVVLIVIGMTGRKEALVTKYRGPHWTAIASPAHRYLYRQHHISAARWWQSLTCLGYLFRQNDTAYVYQRQTNNASCGKVANIITPASFKA